LRRKFAINFVIVFVAHTAISSDHIFVFSECLYGNFLPAWTFFNFWIRSILWGFWL